MASQTDVEIIAWHGACEVHERFSGEEPSGLPRGRSEHPRHRPPGMPARCHRRSGFHRVRGEDDQLGEIEPPQYGGGAPEVDFVRPCNLCPHMKRIQLPKILDSLLYIKEEVFIDPLIAARAALGGADGES